MMNTLSLEEAGTFFKRYTKFFDEENWPEFASLFHEPAMSVRGDGSVHVLASKPETEAFFQKVSASWRKESYDTFSISDMHVLPLGTLSGLVTFTWHMNASDGKVIKQWRQSYQLVRANAGWRVLCSTFHVSRNLEG
jgi:hypothetical protein